ncbi:hypothetical protein B0T16DRAFT_204853 [Cercophora newfieldiana]|uniref:Uncharacterized protein n=1 Tax=Cercophora newfieldiana TaxID=92897 RepID=A0AA39XVE2_9PEZI|nr:hypothetical protein B0T16DRAFT_204853 [Cercophora newfieldiana]
MLLRAVRHLRRHHTARTTVQDSHRKGGDNSWYVSQLRPRGERKKSLDPWRSTRQQASQLHIDRHGRLYFESHEEDKASKRSLTFQAPETVVSMPLHVPRECSSEIALPPFPSRQTYFGEGRRGKGTRQCKAACSGPELSIALGCISGQQLVVSTALPPLDSYLSKMQFQGSTLSLEQPSGWGSNVLFRGPKRLLQLGFPLGRDRTGAGSARFVPSEPRDLDTNPPGPPGQLDVQFPRRRS